MHPSGAFPLRGLIVERLAGAIRALGHRVEFVKLGVGKPHRYVGARRRVAEAIRLMKPDVVHVHFGYSGLAVPHHAPPIVTSFYGDDLHGTWHDGGGTTLKSKVGILVSQVVALRSTRCIVVSQGLRERLWFAAARHKTTVVRDAVDPQLFRPLPRDSARARFGIEPDSIRILFPHDVSQPTKRLWLAQAAVDQFKAIEPKAQLWIVNGKPPDDMPWYYAAADVMVITSALESGPSSAKEALACGLPVVAVPVGDVQLFEDAPGAMLRAEPRPNELAEALRRAISSAPAVRRSRLPNALTLDAAAARIEEVYQTTLALRSREGRRGA